MLPFAGKNVYLLTLYIFASWIDSLAWINKARYPLLMILRYRKSMITTFLTVPYSYKNTQCGRFGYSPKPRIGGGGTHYYSNNYYRKIRFLLSSVLHLTKLVPEAFKCFSTRGTTLPLVPTMPDAVFNLKIQFLKCWKKLNFKFFKKNYFFE